MLAIGNEELKGQMDVKKGDMIHCNNCGKEHPLEYGTDKESGKEINILGFIQCGDRTFLKSIKGKLLK